SARSGRRILPVPTAAASTVSVVTTTGRPVDITAIVARWRGGRSPRRRKPLRRFRALAPGRWRLGSLRARRDRPHLPQGRPAIPRRACGSTRIRASTTARERAGTARRRKGRTWPRPKPRGEATGRATEGCAGELRHRSTAEPVIAKIVRPLWHPPCSHGSHARTRPTLGRGDRGRRAGGGVGGAGAGALLPRGAGLRRGRAAQLGGGRDARVPVAGPDRSRRVPAARARGP